MWVYRGYDIIKDLGKYRVSKDDNEPLYFGDSLGDAQDWIDAEKRKEFNAKQK